jgi:hypothetical protein
LIKPNNLSNPNLLLFSLSNERRGPGEGAERCEAKFKDT